MISNPNEIIDKEVRQPYSECEHGIPANTICTDCGADHTAKICPIASMQMNQPKEVS